MRLRREVRNIGGSIGLTFPKTLVWTWGLKPGDEVVLEWDEDKGTMKFFKVTTTRTPVGGEQPEAVG